MSGIDEARRAALQQCEAEPIHAPDAVQPHGAVLCLDPDGLSLAAASASAAPMLGFDPSLRLGQPIERLLGRPFAELVQAAGRLLNESAPGPHRFAWQHPYGKSFDAWLSRSGSLWILDLERRHFQKAEAALLASARTLQSVAAMPIAGSDEDIAAHVARAARELTGFDHALVYRFHDDWHGEVIAESTERMGERWLGLHWPATDIPPQARALYLLNPVRQIPDVDARPSALLRRSGLPSPDLSRSVLRSTSPYHLQYLRNMGVKASLVGSLIEGGRLWGLVACHHHGSAWYTCAEEREAFAWLCRELMARLARSQDLRRFSARESLALHRLRALDLQAEPARSAADKALLSQALAGLADADVAIHVDEEPPQQDATASDAPATPEALAAQQLVRAWAPDDAGLLHHTASLTSIAEAAGHKVHPALADASADLLKLGHAGAIVARAPHGGHMVWLRQEWRRTLRWGGNPNQPVEVNADGRPSPRTSFATWLEQTQGSARPWSPEELDSVRLWLQQRRPARAASDSASTGEAPAGGITLRYWRLLDRLRGDRPAVAAGWVGWPWLPGGEAQARPLRPAEMLSVPASRASAWQWGILERLQADALQAKSEDLPAVVQRPQWSAPVWLRMLEFDDWVRWFTQQRRRAADLPVQLVLDVQDALDGSVPAAHLQRFAEQAHAAGIGLRAWGLGAPNVNLGCLVALSPEHWRAAWWIAAPDISPGNAETRQPATSVPALWQRLLDGIGLETGRSVAASTTQPPWEATGSEDARPSRWSIIEADGVTPDRLLADG